jgi:copper chaperone NosL
MKIEMKLLFLLIPIWLSCSKGPKAIDYGRDECTFCKMTIMDKRFGCQIVNTKGKHFNFDDLSCMIGYLETGVIARPDIGVMYVPDYLAENNLLPAEGLFYVASEKLHSPMAGNVAAFSIADSAAKYAESLPGQLTTWDKIIKSNE